MSKILADFVDAVRDERLSERSNFAREFCGPQAVFSSLVRKLRDAAAGSVPLSFVEALDLLDSWFKKRKEFANFAPRVDRWLGLSHVVRAKLVPGGDVDRWIREAKQHFDAAWAGCRARSEADFPAIPTADAIPAKAGMFSTYDRLLHPWTVGSWMVWDILTQLNDDQPIVSEKTNVLFSDGHTAKKTTSQSDGGQAMKLVVEIVPGAAGLVTPNWWKLGLTGFSAESSDKYFLGAIQRGITLALPANFTKRVRWHLEAKDNSQVWQHALEGRSGEAAAACVTLAAIELLDEREKSGDPEHKLESVLDEHVAISALVGGNGTTPILDRPLLPVNKDTLPGKFRATAEYEIDEVGFASDQIIDNEPTHPRCGKLATVEKALEFLRLANLEPYALAMRSKDLFQYHVKKTPVKS